MAKIPIILKPGRADGKLATSDAIFDENKGMFQSELNDIQDTLNSNNPNKPLSANQGKVLKELLDAKVIEVGGIPIDTEPIEGNITHIVNSDGLAKKFNKHNTEIILGSVYDISSHNNGAVFESLQALLSSSDLNTLIPTSVRHGGMSIRFIQSSVSNSDNNYVQYRLMSDTFNITPSNWQGVDDEPTTNSENLVKSGGVAKMINNLCVVRNSNNVLSYENGNLINFSTAAYKVTDYIDVSFIYYIAYSLKSGLHDQHCVIAAYDENKNYIQENSVPITEDFGIHKGFWSKGSTTKYIRLAFQSINAHTGSAFSISERTFYYFSNIDATPTFGSKNLIDSNALFLNVNKLKDITKSDAVRNVNLMIVKENDVLHWKYGEQYKSYLYNVQEGDIFVFKSNSSFGVEYAIVSSSSIIEDGEEVQFVEGGTLTKLNPDESSTLTIPSDGYLCILGNSSVNRWPSIFARPTHIFEDLDKIDEVLKLVGNLCKVLLRGVGIKYADGNNGGSLAQSYAISDYIDVADIPFISYSLYGATTDYCVIAAYDENKNYTQSNSVRVTQQYESQKGVWKRGSSTRYIKLAFSTYNNIAEYGCAFAIGIAEAEKLTKPILSTDVEDEVMDMSQRTINSTIEEYCYYTKNGELLNQAKVTWGNYVSQGGVLNPNTSRMVGIVPVTSDMKNITITIRMKSGFVCEIWEMLSVLADGDFSGYRGADYIPDSATGWSQNTVASISAECKSILVWIKQSSDAALNASTDFINIMELSLSYNGIPQIESVSPYSLANNNETILVNKNEETKGKVFANNNELTLFNPYNGCPSKQYKGQMHCHTTNSDGEFTALDVVTKYKRAGYDFITISDHNYITHEPDGNQLVWLCDSYEDTADAQHMNVYNVVGNGTEGVYKYQNMYSVGSTIPEKIAHYETDGISLIAINHPDDIDQYVTNEAINAYPKGVVLAEVWNSAIASLVANVGTRSQLPPRTRSQAIYYIVDEQKYVRYTRVNGSYTYVDIDNYVAGNTDRAFGMLLDKGYKVFCIAVDDFHRDAQFNYGWIKVFANSKDKNELWNSICRGCYYASSGVSLKSINCNNGVYRVELDTNEHQGQSATFKFIGSNNTILQQTSGTSAEYKFSGAESFVRCIVEISTGNLVYGTIKAYTNPVWVKETKKQYDF